MLYFWLTRTKQTVPSDTSGTSWARPALEILEDRTTPANVFWDGGAGTLDWNDAANWSNDVLPGVNDDVTIDVVEQITVVHNSGATTIKSLNSKENLTLSGGSIALGGSSRIEGTFINSSLLVLANGSLRLDSGESVGGQFELSGFFDVRNFVVDNASSIQASGQVDIHNSTIAGSYNVGTLTRVFSSDLDFSASDRSNGFGIGTTLEIRGVSTVDLGINPVSVERLFLQTGTMVAGDLTVTQEMEWVNGTLAGNGTTTVVAGATLEMVTPNIRTLDGHTLINQGTATLSNPGSGSLEVRMVNGAVLENQGTLHFERDQGRFTVIDFDNSNSIFRNSGLLNLRPQASIRLRARFEHSGTLTYESGGNFIVDSGGQSTGGRFDLVGFLALKNFTLDDTSVIAGIGQIDLTSTTLAGTFDFSGSLIRIFGGNVDFGVLTRNNPDELTRQLEVRGATVNLGSDAHSFENLVLRGGSLLAEDLTVTQEMEWQNGTLTGNGNTTIAAGATLKMVENSGRTLDGHTLINQGATTLSNPSINPLEFRMLNDAILDNLGTMTFQDVQGSLTLANFDNSNLFFRNSGTINVLQGGPVFVRARFENSGTVDLQRGQFLVESGGQSTGGKFQFTGGGDLRLKDFNLDETSSIVGPGFVQLERRTVGLWLSPVVSLGCRD